MAGPRGLMIFIRINQGEIISLSGESKQCSLYLVGNPVIANKIISIDIRGSFFLAALERPELNEIGVMLDQKIDGVADALRKT